MDLLLEVTGEHLISLIEYEDLQVVGLEEAFLHHVVNTPRGTNNNMDALLKDLDFIADYGSTNASVDLDSYELANLLDNESDLLSELTGGDDHQGLSMDGAGVNDLKDRDRKTSCFASS